MNELRFSLLTDGPSDVVLLPILRWLLEQHLPKYGLQGTWADTRPFRQHKLEDRITRAVEYYPCDLLFVHRDAEREPMENRYVEVQEALQRIIPAASVPVVCVVPVRMQEAWLLFNEVAIRYAADNSHGRMSLNMPSISRIETLPDPKETLYELLKQASGLRGRRLDRFQSSQHALRVADYIEDYAPLRSLSAFHLLEKKLVETLRGQGWL